MTDRRVLGYRTQSVEAKGLALRVKAARLKQGKVDQSAVERAFERLSAWLESGTPVPLPEVKAGQRVEVVERPAEPRDPSQRDAKERAERDQTEAQEAWIAAYEGRVARHERRRGQYPAVAPRDPSQIVAGVEDGTASG